MHIAVNDDEKHSRNELIHQILTVLPDAKIAQAHDGSRPWRFWAARSSTSCSSTSIWRHGGHGACRACEKADAKGADCFCDGFIANTRWRLSSSASTTTSSSRSTRAASGRSWSCCRQALGRRRVRKRWTSLPSLSAATPTSSRFGILFTSIRRSPATAAHPSFGCEYASPVSLSEYEQRLSGSGFLRIHKTCIVQLQVIRDIFPWSNSGFGCASRARRRCFPSAAKK